MRYCKERKRNLFILVRKLSKGAKQFWTGKGWSWAKQEAVTLEERQIVRLLRKPPTG
ncbi:MAG: hypothetical protein UU80_C0018G0021 [candidate division WWE3 bacterium GW2011_GWA1_41_8]|uniref:Uncharacterized protein n=2 Tax=Katanobacteria TaxID=422282 RepID=A0A0G0XAB7_UNCKA|nr:MAG: hypothetical protein UU72_C0019G0019 [candidate division WWE3 bacterium GW2011_GWB1_41_6]KKS21885.1 MAG: hypothetical protein UU80_C0018G0021 [candidate division WWE3 bacterium GW2011_GWA1_41_8]